MFIEIWVSYYRCKQKYRHSGGRVTGKQLCHAGTGQGRLTKGEGSVRLTPSLR
jgi:hypothetical protein